MAAMEVSAHMKFNCYPCYMSLLPITHIRPKKTCVSGQTVSPKLMRARGFFFFFFLLVRFLYRGKRSEMVPVVSRYERNEI